MSALRPGFSRARSALQRLPAWLLVAALFVLLFALVAVLRWATGDYDTARVAAGVSVFVLSIVVLVVRGKDGWSIYGTVLIVGFGVGLLPFSNEWQAVLQGCVASVLAYLFIDRGWPNERSAVDGGSVT